MAHRSLADAQAQLTAAQSGLTTAQAALAAAETTYNSALATYNPQIQQFLAENHLRWDSLGEFLALGPSLELLADHDDKESARLAFDA